MKSLLFTGILFLTVSASAVELPEVLKSTMDCMTTANISGRGTRYSPHVLTEVTFQKVKDLASIPYSDLNPKNTFFANVNKFSYIGLNLEYFMYIEFDVNGEFISWAGNATLTDTHTGKVYKKELIADELEETDWKLRLGEAGENQNHMVCEGWFPNFP